MSYDPTNRVLRNEMDLVSLALHGYGPAELPVRRQLDQDGQLVAFGEYWAVRTMLFQCPDNPRPGHINAPVDYAPRS